MNTLKTIAKHRHFHSLLVGLGAGAIHWSMGSVLWNDLPTQLPCH